MSTLHQIVGRATPDIGSATHRELIHRAPEEFSGRFKTGHGPSRPAPVVWPTRAGCCGRSAPLQALFSSKWLDLIETVAPDRSSIERASLRRSPRLLPRRNAHPHFATCPPTTRKQPAWPRRRLSTRHPRLAQEADGAPQL